MIMCLTNTTTMKMAFQIMGEMQNDDVEVYDNTVTNHSMGYHLYF